MPDAKRGEANTKTRNFTLPFNLVRFVFIFGGNLLFGIGLYLRSFNFSKKKKEKKPNRFSPARPPGIIGRRLSDFCNNPRLSRVIEFFSGTIDRDDRIIAHACILLSSQFLDIIFSIRSRGSPGAAIPPCKPMGPLG